MEKVTVERLPNTKDVVGAKRWTEERGEFVQISYQEEIRHLALFEIRKGFSRGGHYHAKKEEIFYIVSGKIKARLWDLDTQEKEEGVFKKGDRVRIQPRCGHLFDALKDTVVVEYSPHVYEPEDSYVIDFERSGHGSRPPKSSNRQ